MYVNNTVCVYGRKRIYLLKYELRYELTQSLQFIFNVLHPGCMLKV